MAKCFNTSDLRKHMKCKLALSEMLTTFPIAQISSVDQMQGA